MTVVTRRRAITILAGTGACVAAGLPVAARSSARILEWRGAALGADALMIFGGRERARAQSALKACLAEVERLEAIFSLFREDSELSRLNAAGRLSNPSPELHHLIALGIEIGRRSEGAFDITVQPLWRAIADNFAGDGVSSGPAPGDLSAAISRVDYRRIEISPENIKLRPGMAITLNGIAQGFITDRIADLLAAQGWRDILIQLGETRALDGRAWPVQIERKPLPLMLRDRAIATSSGAGTPFESSGAWHHLIDPATGRSVQHHRAVSVVAPRATVADALSTALIVADPEKGRRIIARFANVRAIFEAPDGGFVEAGRG